MSCSGIHCAGCGAGASAPVVALAGLFGLTWVAAHVIEVAVVAGACGVLSAAAVVWLMGWQDRRQAAFAARGPLLVTRADAAPLPQVTRGTQPPAIENHYHVHHHYAEAPEAARVIRAIPGTAGDAIQGGK